MFFLENLIDIKYEKNTKVYINHKNVTISIETTHEKQQQLVNNSIPPPKLKIRGILSCFLTL